MPFLSTLASTEATGHCWLPVKIPTLYTSCEDWEVERAVAVARKRQRLLQQPLLRLRLQLLVPVPRLECFHQRRHRGRRLLRRLPVRRLCSHSMLEGVIEVQVRVRLDGARDLGQGGQDGGVVGDGVGRHVVAACSGRAAAAGLMSVGEILKLIEPFNGSCMQLWHTLSQHESLTPEREL